MLVDRPECENQATLEPPGPQVTPTPLGLRWGATAEHPMDSRAQAFFDEQSELIALEKARLRDRRWKDRASLALQAIGVVVGASVVVAVGAMVWSARQDHGLVIEPFSVPPDLAAHGLTGQVVASQLLDKLSTMQSRAVSSRPADSYRNNWGDNIEVANLAPAGLALGLDRWLHARLSQQTHVSGEVVETAQGLSVTARTEQGGDSFSAGPGDLDKLMQQSAEAIYRRAQPYRYAVYLMTVGQMDQGLELLTQLGNGPAGPDRVWANSVLGNLLVARGETAAGLARNLDAVKAEPKDPHAWSTLATSLNSLGHAEGALAAAQKSDGLLRSRPSAEAAGYRDLALMQNQASLAAAVGDFRTAADRDARASVLPGAFGDGGASRSQAVADLAQARYGDAVRDGEALEGVAAEPASFQAWLERGWVLRVEMAKLAYAHAMAGDFDGADVIAAQTPADCYDCLRMRGRIAAVARNWLQAERWFDQATRSAPSLPFAWTDWGRMRLARGDVSGAITVLKTAHEKGPRFADPLELWGEALMAGHDYPGAVGKFAEADRDAPAWGRNHLLWGEALMLSGRYREARAQFEAADRLSLSRPDRAALRVLLARTSSGRLHG